MEEDPGLVLTWNEEGDECLDCLMTVCLTHGNYDKETIQDSIAFSRNHGDPRWKEEWALYQIWERHKARQKQG